MKIGDKVLVTNGDSHFCHATGTIKTMGNFPNNVGIIFNDKAIIHYFRENELEVMDGE